MTAFDTKDFENDTLRFLDRVRHDLLREMFINQAWLYMQPANAEPLIQLMAFPDADDVQMRLAIKAEAEEKNGVFVLAALEYWIGKVDPTDPASRARVSLAHQAGLVHMLSGRERGEMVRVYAESADEPITIWQAEITRPGGVVHVDEWEKMEARAPRPGFKRYLVEKTVGLGTVLPYNTTLPS